MGRIKPIGSLERDLGKEALLALAETDAQEVITSDRYDLLKVYVEMKRYDLYFQTLMGRIRDAALIKAQETGLKSFNYADAKVTNIQRNVFKFDADPTWQKLHKAVEEVKARLKEHEEILKNLEGDHEQFVDEETGELIALVAPTCEVVETIMVKL